ncbi:hypothetical protein CFP65_1363 [Kitasatospora sp. MMS16-BH015]|uniref:hypothetical protein n=1 Tax=Kitasatospora sp. MMS16-BH015 TaxID=2018025 RepID=UPI000CA1F4CB|nr:hypothetical protein [Kitasatospora sp. MMS16-BH015]AUG76262.1 hypothetical protein CFP65_1363 [Kitasatospora sp. MMS16-BH015]
MQDGTIRISRDHDPKFPFFEVWVDGAQVGRLYPGGEIAVPVRPGHHRVQLRWSGLRWVNRGKRDSETYGVAVTEGAVVGFDSRVEFSGWPQTRIRLRRA